MIHLLQMHKFSKFLFQIFDSAFVNNYNITHSVPLNLSPRKLNGILNIKLQNSPNLKLLFAIFYQTALAYVTSTDIVFILHHPV